METPNVPRALAIARKQGWHFDIMSTSFYLVTTGAKTGRALGHAALAGSAIHWAGQVGERRN
jgi:K+ transporter